VGHRACAIHVPWIRYTYACAAWNPALPAPPALAWHGCMRAPAVLPRRSSAVPLRWDVCLTHRAAVDIVCFAPPEHVAAAASALEWGGIELDGDDGELQGCRWEDTRRAGGGTPVRVGVWLTARVLEGWRGRGERAVTSAPEQRR
jgi:hypothetical protein